MQKKIVFDVVFITGDESVFELRFRKLHSNVDYFLIFGTKESLEKVDKHYIYEENKLILFPTENTFSVQLGQEEQISSLILETIKRLYCSFEDLIFFSLSNEIFDVSNLNEIDIKSKDVNFLINDVYEGNFDRKRKYSEIGPILMNFSHLLKNKKRFLQEVLNFKFNLKTQDSGIKNGFKILNFTNDTNTLPDYYECPFSGRFIEYIFERNHRKFVFSCDEEIDEIECDFVFKLKFVKKFPESNFIDLRNKIQELEIFIPEIPLYHKNLEDFQSDYKINKIYSVLSTFDCKDGDDIEIYLEKGLVKKLKFHEIKNPSFREGFKLF